MHKPIYLKFQKWLLLRVRVRNLYLRRKNKTKTCCLNDVHPRKSEVPYGPLPTKPSIMSKVIVVSFH